LRRKKETILDDSTDAEWVADIYPKLKEEYTDIEFLVDLTESADSEALLNELPDGSVKKVRVTSLDTDLPGEFRADVPKSPII
jgi:hypothetical protein